MQKSAWLITWLMFTVAPSTRAGGETRPCPRTAHSVGETARNRRIVERFAKLLYGEHQVARAFDEYVAPGYVQHNPNIADGRRAAIAALQPMFARKGATFAVKQILVDGNLAAIHLFGRADPSTPGGAVVDIYRLAHGRIVEHWDVIEPIALRTRNPHPYF